MLRLVEYVERDGKLGYSTGEEVSVYGQQNTKDPNQRNATTWSLWDAGDDRIVDGIVIKNFLGHTNDEVIQIRGTVSESRAIDVEMGGHNLTSNKIR